MTIKINWLRPLAFITDRYIAKTRSATIQRLRQHANNVSKATGYEYDEKARTADPSWQFMAPLDIIVSLAWLFAHDDQGRLTKDALLKWLWPDDHAMMRLQFAVLLRDSVYYERDNPFSPFSGKQAYCDVEHPTISNGAYMCMQLAGLFHTRSPNTFHIDAGISTEARGFVGRTRPSSMPHSYSPSLPPVKAKVFERGHNLRGLTSAQVLCQFIAAQMVRNRYSSVSTGLPIGRAAYKHYAEYMIAPLTDATMADIIRGTEHTELIRMSGWCRTLAYACPVIEALGDMAREDRTSRKLNPDDGSTGIIIELRQHTVNTVNILKERIDDLG